MAAQQPARERSFVDKRKGDTMVNVLLGGVVAFVVSLFAPFVGQIAGGAVSGYLQQEDRASGAKVGALASVLASLPAVLLAVVVLSFLGFGTVGAVGGGDAGGGIALLLFLFVAVAIIVGVAVVLGALGGYVGAILAEE